MTPDFRAVALYLVTAWVWVSRRGEDVAEWVRGWEE